MRLLSTTKLPSARRPFADLYLGALVFGTPNIAAETGTLRKARDAMGWAVIHLRQCRKELALETGRELQVPPGMSGAYAKQVGQCVVEPVAQHDDMEVTGV